MIELTKEEKEFLINLFKNVIPNMQVALKDAVVVKVISENILSKLEG
jgi:hypothetical protein